MPDLFRSDVKPSDRPEVGIPNGISTSEAETALRKYVALRPNASDPRPDVTKIAMEVVGPKDGGKRAAISRYLGQFFFHSGGGSSRYAVPTALTSPAEPLPDDEPPAPWTSSEPQPRRSPVRMDAWKHPVKHTTGQGSTLFLLVLVPMFIIALSLLVLFLING